MKKETDHKITYTLSNRQETEIVLSLIVMTYALAIFYVKCLETKLASFLRGLGWQSRQIEGMLLISLFAFIVWSAYLLLKMERYVRENYQELSK